MNAQQTKAETRAHYEKLAAEAATHQGFHDFRDYPQRDRPDWDLDARGNPLRPGS